METTAVKSEGTAMPPEPKPLVLTASVGPHIASGESVERIMWTVNAALIPAAAMSVYYFGLRALFVMAVSIISCIAFEAATQKIMGVKSTAMDGSAFLTGLLLGMNLPAGVPLYLPVIGSLVAIIITKQLFGGLGFNIFNPALIARAFLLASFPKLMTTWPVPTPGFDMGLDAKTAATPLAIMKEEGIGALLAQFDGRTEMYFQMLVGHRGGSLGEVSAVALLIGGIYLLYKKYITWHIPVSFIATVAVISWLTGGDPVVSILSGGLILGAFFMATDYVTVPQMRNAQILFGVGCGAITSLIRLKGGYPEGVAYSILLMNCFTPLIDRAFQPKKFGEIKAKA